MGHERHGLSTQLIVATIVFAASQMGAGGKHAIVSNEIATAISRHCHSVTTHIGIGRAMDTMTMWQQDQCD